MTTVAAALAAAAGIAEWRASEHRVRSLQEYHADDQLRLLYYWRRAPVPCSWDGHPVPSEHARRVPRGPTHGVSRPAACGGDPNPAAPPCAGT